MTRLEHSSPRFESLRKRTGFQEREGTRWTKWKWRVGVALTIQAIVITAAVGTSYLSPVTGTFTTNTAYVKVYGCSQAPPSGWSNETPLSREFPAVAEDSSGDSQNGLTLMFGGQTWNTGSVVGDTWEYQNGCWAQVNSSTQTSWQPCGYGQPVTMPFCGAPTTTESGTAGSTITWAVPSGVNYISVDMAGAAGGNGGVYLSGNGGSAGTGGLGGRVQATIPVTPGDTLDIAVGDAGGNGLTTCAAGNGGAAGYSGSGTAGAGGDGCGGGGGGGGYSKIYDATGNFLLAVAGGGGGGGGDYGNALGYNAGNGGGGGNSGSNGASGNDGTTNYGGGGSDTAGGSAGTGYLVSGGAGGSYSGGGGASGKPGTNNDGAGGGGGSGYYGGGGGGDGLYSGGGGGGGDSHVAVGAIYTYTSSYRSGNGYVTITYPTAPPTKIEPMPRFGASLAYDATFGAFILYGGCTTISTLGAAYPDICSTSTSSTILSDTWAFYPGSTLGTGYWRLVTSATCDSGYPWISGGDSKVDPTAGYGYLFDHSCEFIFSFGTTAYVSGSTYCASGDQYCGSLGEYGGSMVYDPYATQCHNAGAYTCILLYGGATYFSDHGATGGTDVGPCTSNYYYDHNSLTTDLGNYCSDTLWELDGSSILTFYWLDENSAVTYNTTSTADSWSYKAYTYFGPGNTPYDYPSGEGRAFASLIAPNCSSSSCTLILTGGEEPSASSAGEAAQADTWYITGSVYNAAWSHVTSSEVAASEAAVEVYDQIPSGTFSDKVVYTGGVAPTGGSETAIAITGVYYLNPSSPSSGWTLDTMSAHPTDIYAGTGFYDTANQLVIVYGGWDMTLNEPASEYYLN